AAGSVTGPASVAACAPGRSIGTPVSLATVSPLPVCPGFRGSGVNGGIDNTDRKLGTMPISPGMAAEISLDSASDTCPEDIAAARPVTIARKRTVIPQAKPSAQRLGVQPPGDRGDRLGVARPGGELVVGEVQDAAPADRGQ